MGYKNMKKQKAHIEELRKDPFNWRTRVKRRKKAKNILNPNDLSLEKLEKMLGL